jgi:hypothetical protein
VRVLRCPQVSPLDLNAGDATVIARTVSEFVALLLQDSFNGFTSLGLKPRLVAAEASAPPSTVITPAAVDPSMAAVQSRLQQYRAALAASAQSK